MNKLKYILGIVVVMTIQSCTDFVEPAIPYSGFDTGVYLRTIASSANISRAAAATATYDLTLEAVDAENGGTVSKVDVLVSRRRGATVLAEKPLNTIDGAAFVAQGASKYTRANYSVSVAAAMTALGLTTADLAVGDFVEFRLVLTDTKGRTFSNNNLSSDASGGVYYRSPFFYRVPVVN